MTNTATLTSKGQITIPKEIREKLGLKKGDKLVLIEKDGNVILRKVSLEEIRQKALENYESGNTLSHEDVFENLK